MPKVLILNSLICLVIQLSTLSQHPTQTLAPAFMGPNALPIPDFRFPLVSNLNSVGISTNWHFAKGDFTQNPYFEVYKSISSRCAIITFMSPIEYFEISEDVKNRRKIDSSYSNSGYAIGDFYFGFQLNLLEGHEFLPEISLENFCRTASSENVAQARFTDSPGYWVNFCFGKEFCFFDSKLKTKITVTQGLYVWQTYDYPNPQNDAHFYGLKLENEFGKLGLKFTYSGYSGWKENGDKPRTLRCVIYRNFNRHSIGIEYQKGLRDFPYQTVSIAWNFYFGRSKFF